MVPTAPAIANAIYNAVGVRVQELPITPEKVLDGIEAGASAPQPVAVGAR
jgi:CO/xanthine dehydrogenase Mo-binding subunit